MHSLRNHLILQVFVPLALLTSIFVWTTFTAVEGLIESRLEKEIELVARSLRMPVEGALINGDYRRLQEALGAVFEIGRVYGAYVYDASGRRIAVAGEAIPGPREQIQAAELVALGEERGLYEDLAGEPVYSYFVPLTGHGGRIDGLLQVVREESDIALRLGQIRKIGTISLVVVLAIMLGLLVLGHRLAVVRPMERLLGDMGRVEQGDRDWRAAIQGPREVSGLARGVNRMLDSLRRAESELAARRRAELEMSERLRVQEKDAALGRFSSGLVHELGAPLTVIDGDARRLGEAVGSDREARRRLERIRAQVERTRSLIQQLMNFVREDRRDMEPVAIQGLINQTLSGARPEADSRGVELKVDNPHSNLTLPGLEVRLEQALLNLVRNAMQAAAREVRIVVERAPETLRIAVEDDGPGVETADRERIFEPFLSNRPDGSGTGLGLAIVKSVVEEHGGRVWVESSADLGGSRFIMEFATGDQHA